MLCNTYAEDSNVVFKPVLSYSWWLYYYHPSFLLLYCFHSCCAKSLQCHLLLSWDGYSIVVYRLSFALDGVLSVYRDLKFSFFSKWSFLFLLQSLMALMLAFQTLKVKLYYELWFVPYHHCFSHLHDCTADLLCTSDSSNFLFLCKRVVHLVYVLSVDTVFFKHLYKWAE